MVRRTATAATAVLAVLIGGGCCAGCGATAPSSGTAPVSVAATGPTVPAEAASPTVATMPAAKATPVARGSSSAAAPASSARSGAAASAGSATSVKAGATAGSTAVQGGTPAAQVLGLINQARAAAGLPALTVTSGLEASSAAHNLRMAGGCGLSHQCPGEAALGARETAAGVSWTAAGENIGEGGPVVGTTSAIAQMAVGLTQSMLNERPPDDGHRMNILSSTFTHIGIAVYRDGGGTVWLTQDFSN